MTGRRAGQDRGEEQALLDLVYADPGRDDSRAVYADWLLERGDPRGEHILLQLGRATRPAGQDSELRERALVRAHGADWLGPLKSCVVPGSAVFRRGFLAECAVSFRSPAQRDALAHHPMWATVERVACEDVEFLASPALTALRVAGPLSPGTLAGLARSPARARIRELRVELPGWPLPRQERSLAAATGEAAAGAWSFEVFIATLRAFEFDRLALGLPGRYVSSYASGTFAPALYLDLLQAGPVARLSWLGVRRCLLLPYPEWRTYGDAHPQLLGWLREPMLARGRGRTIALQPYQGWIFSLLWESKKPILSVEWNTACAGSDLRCLDLAIEKVERKMLARVEARIVGFRRPHHEQALRERLRALGDVTLL